MPLRRFKVNWVLNEELAIGTAPCKHEDLEKLSKEGIKWKQGDLTADY